MSAPSAPRCRLSSRAGKARARAEVLVATKGGFLPGGGDDPEAPGRALRRGPMCAPGVLAAADRGVDPTVGPSAAALGYRPALIGASPIWASALDV